VSTLAALAATPFQLLEEMERRCRAAAAGRSARVADVSEWVGVGFRMNRVLLVSSRDQVREVFNYPDAITRIPGARRWLRGLANVRGTLLPIIDLQQFLGGDETVNGRSTRIVVVNHGDVPAGLVVDEVRGFRRFTDEDRETTDGGGLPALQPFLAGGYRRGEEQWTVLDLHRLVESPVFLQAAQ
jgi:twitching motility protein PilI